MNSGKTVFAQLMDFILSAYEFRCCVERYHGNYKVKSFSCWDQFLTLAFAQLTYRETLRDIEACLRARWPRYCARQDLKDQMIEFLRRCANQMRDWRIYADFAHIFIQETLDMGLWMLRLNPTLIDLRSASLRRSWTNPLKIQQLEIQNLKGGRK